MYSAPILLFLVVAQTIGGTLCGISNVTPGHTSHPIPDSEILALQTLFDELNGEQWTNNDGWIEMTDPCRIFGIGCAIVNGAAHVTEIALTGNNCVGKLPRNLAQGFPHLEYISMGNNQISGRLPSMPVRVYAISFRNNRLTRFPPNLCTLSELKYLHLDFNSILDIIPDCLDRLPKLSVIGITRNMVVGQIPPTMGRLKGLTTLMLGMNALTGPFPGDLVTSEKLSVLDLTGNKIEGPIMLQSAPRLVEIMLSGNNMSMMGDVERLAVKFPLLAVLDVRSTNMEGDVTALATTSDNLSFIAAGGTAISGVCPTPTVMDSWHVHYMDLAGCPLVCPFGATSVPQGMGCLSMSLYTISMGVPDKMEITIKFKQSLGTNVLFRDSVEFDHVQCVYDDNINSGASMVVSDGTFSGNTRYGVVKCTYPRVFTTLSIYIRGVKATESLELNIHTHHDDKKGYDGNTEDKYSSDSPPLPELPSVSATPVVVEIFGMSKCPDLVSFFHEIMYPAIDAIRDVVTVKMSYVLEVVPEYPTGMWSLHGQTETIGDAAISCALKYGGLDGMLKFTECIWRDMGAIPTDVDKCAREIEGRGPAVVKCAFSQEGFGLLPEGAERGKAMGVSWSPTIVINGKIECLWGSIPCSFATPEEFIELVMQYA